MENPNPKFDLNSSVANKIKELRNKLNLNQRKFSELISISPSAYNRIEKGTIPLTLNFIQHIAEATNTSVSELLNVPSITNYTTNNGLQNQGINSEINIHITGDQVSEIKELIDQFKKNIPFQSK